MKSSPEEHHGDLEAYDLTGLLRVRELRVLALTACGYAVVRGSSV